MPDVQYPIIGLVGRARSGKDTFASGLVERGYTRVAFADPLRDTLLKMNPFVGADLDGATPQRLTVLHLNLGWEGIKASTYGSDARRLMQTVGVAARDLEPDIWLRAALRKVLALQLADRPAVITDVRFENEARAIQDAGGILVRVVRPSQITPGLAHISETALDRYPTDFTVRNSGTAADFANLAATLRF